MTASAARTSHPWWQRCRAKLSGSDGNWPTPRCPRYETLTIWRGVACLLVVIYHSLFTGYARALPTDASVAGIIAAVLARGWIGVPLFFVISGYCVITSADTIRRRAKPGWTFFRRRFRRIYPPYWVWVAMVAVTVYLVDTRVRPGFFAGAYVPGPHTLTGWQWVGNLSLTEVWRWRLTGGVESALIAPSWTLCYEEQFYALVGFVLLLAPRFLFGGLSLITAAVLVTFLRFPDLGLDTTGLFLDGKWLMFAAGAWVYYVLNYAPARRWLECCLPLITGMICAAADPRHLLWRRVNEPNQTYFVAFTFALLLILLHRWDEKWARHILLRPLRWCGQMCFSLYLVHWPTVTLVGWLCDQSGLRHPAAILLITLPVCVGSAVTLGWSFHLLVERKFMNQGFAAPALSRPLPPTGPASGPAQLPSPP